MIEEIEAWLQQPIYFEGVQLYSKYGTSKVLLRMFEGASDNFNKEQLRLKLTELLEKAKAEREVIDSQLPTEVLAIKQQTGSLMDERVALRERARLLVATDPKHPDLLEIAFRIAFGIKDELDEAFDKLDFYDRNKCLPEAPQAISQDALTLAKRLYSLRTYTKRNADAQKKAVWEAEILSIEKRLSHVIVP